MNFSNQSGRKLLYYILFTYLISWSMVLIFRLTAPGLTLQSIPAFLMLVAYMFTPMISAIIVQKAIFKQNLKEAFGVRFNWNRWWWIAWLSPVVIAFAAVGVSILFPSVQFSPGMEGLFERFRGTLTPEQMEQIHDMPIHPVFLALIQGLIAGLTINAVAGFGEELGWRGLMVDCLRKFNFWTASLIIGFVWGLWHAPIILMGHNYPQNPTIGVGMMILFTILFSPWFSLVRVKSRSVIAASVLHGSFNAVAGISIMLVKGGNDLLIGTTGLAGLIVLALIDILLFAFYPALRKGTLENVQA